MEVTRQPLQLDLRRLVLLLAGAMCVLPFVQPRHFPPLPAFYDEWLACALGLAAVMLAALSRAFALRRVPTLTVSLVLFALTLFARAMVGSPAYPQSALLWGLYAAFAALIVLLGHQLTTEFGLEKVCDVIAGFLLAAAITNSVTGVLQVVGIPSFLAPVISHLQGNRAIGNIGQANLFANYLALGEASLLYLHARGKLGLSLTVAGGLVLLSSVGFASSRSSILYVAVFIVLASVLAVRFDDVSFRRMRMATLVLAVGVLLAQWLGAVDNSGFIRNSTFPIEGPVPDAGMNMRLIAWKIAGRLFLESPWFGVGPSEFAGAAFSLGLPSKLAGNEIWTSPHNFFFHLLVETGLVGTLLVLSPLIVWWLHFPRLLLGAKPIQGWWLLACAGVELVHAMLEYPLWHAHFLALTALIMGLGASGSYQMRPLAMRATLALGSVIGAMVLSSQLVDYIRFDLASGVSGARSLATEREVIHDRTALEDLSKGLLAPTAERWLFFAFELDDSELDTKIAVGNRVLRLWPTREGVARQSILLAMSGRRDEAATLFLHGLNTYSTDTRSMTDAVLSAPITAQHVLRPLLPRP